MNDEEPSLIIVICSNFLYFLETTKHSIYLNEMIPAF